MGLMTHQVFLASIGLAREATPASPALTEDTWARLFKALATNLTAVTTRATMSALVVDEGVVLVPLNTTIPPREVWKPLACPFCGAWLFRDGLVHTLQHGWH